MHEPTHAVIQMFLIYYKKHPSTSISILKVLLIFGSHMNIFPYFRGYL